MRHGDTGRIPRFGHPREAHTGTLQLLCRRCGRITAVLGIDTTMTYRHPTWFMRSYVPSPTRSPLMAWLFVLTQFRYVDDTKQYGFNDVWQLAQETNQLRQGDCEDTSILLADWLEASGFETRVVLGLARGTGHAWVVLRAEGHEYILETTGDRANFRRHPPRTELLPEYIPRVQFDKDSIWFRVAETWTANYFNDEWIQGAR